MVLRKRHSRSPRQQQLEVSVILVRRKVLYSMNWPEKYFFAPAHKLNQDMLFFDVWDQYLSIQAQLWSFGKKRVVNVK